MDATCAGGHSQAAAYPHTHPEKRQRSENARPEYAPPEGRTQSVDNGVDSEEIKGGTNEGGRRHDCRRATERLGTGPEDRKEG